ncbi:MAG: two-component regulator propeller domain-containing protein, partial [Saprospiraceae bacterium]|nr:two-component regulator propeller domain-containing protein [Saprospiraceae bacterium]
MFKRLNIGNGLSHNYVTDILQDDQGFVWISTQYGLNRYDGREILLYLNDPSDTTSLGDNDIEDMAFDEEGHLWLALNNRGVDRFNPLTEEFTHYELEELPYYVCSDRKGGIWASSLNRLFFKGPGKKNFVRHTMSDHPWGPLNSEFRIYRISRDSKDNIWVDTRWGLYRISSEGGPGVWFLPCSDEYISAENTFIISGTEEAADGTLWVGTHEGLFSLSNGDSCLASSEEVFPKRDIIINAIERDGQGNLWLGTYEQGVYRLHPDSGRYRHFPQSEGSKESLQPAYVSVISTDQSGAIWIGSYYYGVYIYDPATSQFQWYKHNPQTGEKLNSLELNSVFEDSKGVLWMGSFSGMEWAWPESEIVYPALQNFRFQTIQDIYTVTQGRKEIFWIGTELGIKRLDATTGNIRSFFQIYDQRGEDYTDYATTAELLDRNGNFWAGFWGGSLAQIDGQSGEILRTFPCEQEEPSSLRSCLIQSLAETRDGNILIGTAYGGLSIYFPERDSLIHFAQSNTPGQGPSNNYIRSMLEDRTGIIWIGTYGGGLNRLDPQTHSFRHFSIKDGLPEDLIVDMVEDKEGYIWVATGNAISKFDPRKETFQNFDHEDGLPTAQYNDLSGPGPYTGKIHLATSDGFVSFLPEEIKIDTVPPITSITKMEIYRRGNDSNQPLMERSIPFRKEIALSYRDYIVSFEFAAINYRSSEKNRLAYKLEGFNEDWMELGKGRRVTFTSLPAGEYALLVKGSNGDDVWNIQPTSLAISVSPPWWGSGWAFLAYALLAGVLVYTVYSFLLQRQLEKAEARRLQELDALKTRLYTNITHEFRTPLTVIMGLTDQMLNGDWYRSLSDSARNQISHGFTLISRNSKNLLRLVNQLLDLSKLDSGLLEMNLTRGNVINYLEYLTESFYSLAEEKGIRLTFYQEEDELIMEYDEAKLQQVTYNLLSNALKFTEEGGKVILHTKKLEKKGASYLQIKIRDTGVGISDAQIPFIFDRFYQADTVSGTRQWEGTGVGLALTKELVELMGGEIFVSSWPKRGTEFTVILPTTTSGDVSVPESKANTWKPVSEPEFITTSASKEAENPEVIAPAIKESQE